MSRIGASKVSSNSPKVKNESVNLSQLNLNEEMYETIIANRYGRFKPASDRRGLAIVVAGKVGYLDFSPWESAWNRPLLKAQLDVSDTGELQSLRAHTPTGDVHFGDLARGLHFDLSESGEHTTGVLIPTSPVHARVRQARKSIPIFQCPPSSKGVTNHKQVNVIGADVLKRRAEKRRRSQNQVMRRSAAQAMQNYAKQHEKMLTKAALNLLQNPPKAEWLHLVANSLMPKNDRADCRDNLGAATSKDNTRMMVIELMAQILSQIDDVGVQIDACFLKLPMSDVIEKITYTLDLSYNGRSLSLTQHIDVFSTYDAPRCSDQVMLLAAIHLLKGELISFPEQDNNCIAQRASMESKTSESAFSARRSKRLQEKVQTLFGQRLKRIFANQTPPSRARKRLKIVPYKHSPLSVLKIPGANVPVPKVKLLNSCPKYKENHIQVGCHQ